MRRLIVLIIAILVIVLGYNYLYKDHRDIKTEPVAFSLEAAELSSEFSLDPLASERKYLNKTIAVKGTVTENDMSSITLDALVYCQFDNPLSTEIQTNSLLKIKGRLIGYDDLLEQVKLDQCFILE